MSYDGSKKADRKELATNLIARLEECGFECRGRVWGKGHLENTTHELVFERAHHAKPEIKVLVYTSCVDKLLYSQRSSDLVVNPIARRVAKDAIRVVAVYKTKGGEERGLAKASKRVNRTGKVEDIVDRTVERMREVYGSVPSTPRCSCGAPKFTSKKGNLVCADVCWTKK